MTQLATGGIDCQTVSFVPEKTTLREFKRRTVFRTGKVVFVPSHSSPAFDLNPLTWRDLNFDNFDTLASRSNKNSRVIYEAITGANLIAKRPDRGSANVTGHPNCDVPLDIHPITMDDVLEAGA